MSSRAPRQGDEAVLEGFVLTQFELWWRPAGIFNVTFEPKRTVPVSGGGVTSSAVARRAFQ
jgi:hypothetical protein